MPRTALILFFLAFLPIGTLAGEPKSIKQRAWLLLSDSPREIHEPGEITLPSQLTLNQKKPLPRTYPLSKVKIVWFGKVENNQREEDTIVVEEEKGKWATRRGFLDVQKAYVDVRKNTFQATLGVELKAVYLGVPPFSGKAKDDEKEKGKEKENATQETDPTTDFRPPTRSTISDVKNLVYPQFWKLPAQEVIPKFGKDPGQEDYEESKVFIFNSPAHFPLPRFGARGEPMDTAGAVIHEEMRLVIWKEGWYEVVFSLGIPSAPVTVRLQLAVHRRDCPLDPIILTIPPIAMNPDTASQGNWVGSLHRIHHEGFSVRLRDLWHELGDPHTSSVTRTGAARFGPLP